MSKRKNLHKYIPEIGAWNREIGMDLDGNWNDEEAAKEFNENPMPFVFAFNKTIAALCRNIVSYKTQPSVETALSIIQEAEYIGINIEPAIIQVKVAWAACERGPWIWHY